VLDTLLPTQLFARGFSVSMKGRKASYPAAGKGEGYGNLETKSQRRRKSRYFYRKFLILREATAGSWAKHGGTKTGKKKKGGGGVQNTKREMDDQMGKRNWGKKNSSEREPSRKGKKNK